MKHLALALFAAFSLPAQAHDDATLDKVETPNGGQLRMAGAYHLELVVTQDSKDVRENPIVVYLTDHADQKLSSTGVSGTAILIAGKIKATSTLTPDGENRLKGYAKYSSAPDMKVVVQIKRTDGSTEQARFTPLAVEQRGAEAHNH